MAKACPYCGFPVAEWLAAIHAKSSLGLESPGLNDQLTEPEKQILLNALEKHAGNIKRTAEELQVSRTTLYAKLKKHQIDPDSYP